MRIIEHLKGKSPGRNIVFIAIEELKTPEEIKEFYEEYVELLRTQGDTEYVRENPEKVADENIGYVLGYYNQQTAELWMETLPSVHHPIFGRNIPFSEPEKAYYKGLKLQRT
jgi:hypothetical protein